MSGFLLQRLPDLAFEAVVQSMEPLDIFHLTQTSNKTRRMMCRYARLPITIEVIGAFWIAVSFCGNEDQSIKFSLRPSISNTLILKFGGGQEDQANAHYDQQRGAFETYWIDTLHGFKTIINFLSDTFRVSSVSLNGDDEESYNALKHIVDRKLPIQRIEWDSSDSSDAIVNGVLEMSSVAKELFFGTPSDKELKIDLLREYSLDSFELIGAHWLTRRVLLALSNCSTLEVSGTKLTGTDLNALLKHLISSGGRVTKWEICSYVEFEMTTVFDGIKFEEISKSEYREEYTIERLDGVEMSVTYELPIACIAASRPQYTLEVEISES